MSLTYYCWHCYAENADPTGACAQCGNEIGAPPGTDYVQMLLWSLGHPVGSQQMIAAQVLGQRREPQARSALRELALDRTDPYLAATALAALIEIDGPSAHRPLLAHLARAGAPVVRVVAEAALAHRRPDKS